MPKSLKSQHKHQTYVISFRVGLDIFKKITRYGQSQRDDAGEALKPPAAARRLVTKALSQLEPSDPKKRR